MYTRAGNRHWITIDGKTIRVDSNQEEDLIKWLEENGFHDKWRRLATGLHVGKYNYTPDIEASVFLDGMTTRAIVESKPAVSFLGENQSERMRGIAQHYHTELFLLFAHDTKKWYRIDKSSGDVREFGVPIPGKLPAKKLYNPFTKKAPGVHGHTYRQRLQIGKMVTLLAMDGIVAGLRAVFTPRKTRRRRPYYRRRR
jgi:hypothetical protein